MTKIYARCPEGVKVPYLTAGKLYEVVKQNEWKTNFTFLDDDKKLRLSVWECSAHLDGLNWERVELPDTRRKRIQDEAENMVEALEEGRRAIGDHYAPNDCYATGPITGDPFRDLVQCPACSFISMYDAALAQLRSER